MTWLIKIFEKLIDFLMMVLPLSPFTGYNNYLAQIPYLQELNWFLPFGTIIGIGETWLLAIGVFYLYSFIARKLGLTS